MLLLVAALLLMPVRPAADAANLVAELGHGKPLVLHFFASWCGACREEFPRLRKTLLALPSKGVNVELISIDRPEDERKAVQMLADYKLTALPAMLLDAPEPDPVTKAIGEPKWDGTLPATFVFDVRGRLVKSFIGVVAPAALEKAVSDSLRAPGGGL
jgi:thiol-disulfide isomerase/thioredoxin